jgi:hypothetical protein
MNARGSTAMLYGAARGLVKDVFQHQVLLRQHFRAYANWLFKARGSGWLDLEYSIDF